MFLCPVGWHEWRAGDALLYTPREGRTHCVMQYRERVAPVRVFPHLLAETLADDADFIVDSKNKITRFLTDEGEYAALIVVKGTFRGRAIAHVISAVYAEEFSTCLDARVESKFADEYSELVLELTKADRLQLGVRRRRIGFAPPPGWHAIPGLSLEVSLLPPDYPHTHAAITVYAAQPAANAIDPHAYQNLHDIRVGLGEGQEVRRLAMAGSPQRPLHGDEWHTIRELPDAAGAARKMERFLVVLRDDRYLYVAKLEALAGPRVAELHRTFSAMIGTFEPIPHAVAQHGAQPDSPFGLWSE